MPLIVLHYQDQFMAMTGSGKNMIFGALLHLVSFKNENSVFGHNTKFMSSKPKSGIRLETHTVEIDIRTARNIE